jgi:TusA-related sulfurtransferase
MSVKAVKTFNNASKIEIRCNDPMTRRNFKRIAADFKNYEDVIKWVNTNYASFIKIVPPYPVHGGVL